MNDGHLLLVWLGPVQEFIAEARRTRDLWFGSQILSDLSCAGAVALAKADAFMIFPALDKGGTLPDAVANKLLARIAPDHDPETQAKAAWTAIENRWRQVAAEVRQRSEVQKVLAPGGELVWQEQMDDALEFYAAWAPIKDDYSAARDAVEQALAASKRLRQFHPWQHAGANGFERFPKSSLDGARVSVLKRRHERGREFGGLGIRGQEELDAVGVMKRAGLKPSQFVPLPNVAAGHWLDAASRRATNELAALCKACGSRRIKRVGGGRRVVQPLPYDASVLYPARLPAVFEELDGETNPEAARVWGKEHVRPLLKAMKSAPTPYVACLVADGDSMGDTIRSLASADANRVFSRHLGQFPTEARRIVEEENLGSLVYAGGDDVLAFVPVAKALDCAAGLHCAFAMIMRNAALPGPIPTLSVGIGIGHVLEPMGVLLKLGRDAERRAKSEAGKDAVAIIVDKRSGGRSQHCSHWDFPRLREDARLLRTKLSTSKVHALQALLNRFPRCLPDSERQSAALALAGYASDLLAHTGERASIMLSDLGIAVSDDYAALRQDIKDAIDRVLVVRTLCQAGFA